jgi:hypothetical protein
LKNFLEQYRRLIEVATYQCKVGVVCVHHCVRIRVSRRSGQLSSFSRVSFKSPRVAFDQSDARRIDRNQLFYPGVWSKVQQTPRHPQVTLSLRGPSSLRFHRRNGVVKICGEMRVTRI